MQASIRRRSRCRNSFKICYHARNLRNFEVIAQAHHIDVVGVPLMAPIGLNSLAYEEEKPWDAYLFSIIRFFLGLKKLSALSTR
jgi:hypothetical protein